MFGELSVLAKFLISVGVAGGLCGVAVLAERILFRVSKRYRYFIKTGK